MRRTILLVILAAHSATALASGSGAPTRDITPNVGAPGLSTFSEVFAFDRDGMLVLPGVVGFRRSNDGGQHWKRAMDGYVLVNGWEPSINGFCQAPSALATVYSPSGLVLSGMPVFRSDDLGKTWHPMGGIRSLPFSFFADCAVDPANPEVLYLLTDNFTSIPGASLFKSTDGGRSFAAVGSPPSDEWTYRQVRVSPTQPQTVYLIGERFEEPEDSEGFVVGSIFVSHDDGSAFAPLPDAPYDTTRVYLHPRNGMLFVVGTDTSGTRRLFRSIDGGLTFTPGPAWLWPREQDFGRGAAMAFDPKDGAIVYALVGPHKLYRSRDFGATFVKLAGPPPTSIGSPGMYAVGTTRLRDGRMQVYALTDAGPYRSDDGGKTFEGIVDTFRGTAVGDLAIDARGRLMIAAFSSSVVLRGQRPGHPRSESYDVFAANLGTLSGRVIAPSTLDSRVAAVATDAGVFSTANGGAKWTPAIFYDGEMPLGNKRCEQLVFAPGSATRVYCYGSFNLFRSDDAGRTFAAMTMQTASGPVRGIIAVHESDADVIYMNSGSPFSGTLGLFKSLDGGQSAGSLVLPGSISALALDPRDPQTLYAGMSGGGVRRSRDGGATWQNASNGLVPDPICAIATDPNIGGRVYAWVFSDGLFVSTDGGETWTDAGSEDSVKRSAIDGFGLGFYSIAVDTVVPGRVYLGGSGVLQVDTLSNQR